MKLNAKPWKICLRFFLFCILISSRLSGLAQGAFWIIPAHAEELPCIIDEVNQLGINIRYKSEWLQAISVDLRAGDINKLSVIKVAYNISPVLSLKSCSIKADGQIQFSKALEQMQAEAFVKKNLSGLGVKVGVTDAGYLYLNDSVKASDLTHLWKGKQLSATRDFVLKLDTVLYDEVSYTGKKKPMKVYKNWFLKALRDLKLIYHYHGTEVLKMIAGYDALPDYRKGLATDAQYYLARTEDGRKEYREEEDYYIAALEWMEANGVRIVNTSLGYGRGRKVKGTNYDPSDMNGSSMIAKAVTIACNEKNMLVVVAAGNDGDKRRWRVINTPADAKAALTVGAVLSHYEKADYSGTGPEFNDYLKPEVAAYSNQGTSLSAPAVCGFAACLLEMKPELTAGELKEIIIRSSHLYPYGNNYIGYGVPLAGRALQLIDDPAFQFTHTKELHVNGKEYIFSDSTQVIPYLVVFHKKDESKVILQELIRPGKENKSLVLIRPENCTRSTVQAGYRVYEIFWED